MKLHIAVLFDESVAVQVTVVVPLLKADPDEGEQATVGAGVQLSVAVGGVKVTTAVQTFGSVLFVMFAGQAPIVGGWLSLTVTVKLQEPVLPEDSVAVQVTVVVPLLKVEPDAGEQTTVGAGVQLSVAVGGVKVTTAVHTFGSVLFVIFAGQAPIVGAWVSLTVTVKLHMAVLADESVAVQVTVVTPFWKVEPAAGVHIAVAPGQLSEGVGVV